MTSEKFWQKSYDPGLTDLDPKLWETNYIEMTNPIFEQSVNKIALAYMGRQISFGELDKWANQFANLLLDNGFKKGDVVGINLPNIPEYVISWLGTLRAGCAVSGVSPLLSPDEMEYQLNDCEARGLVTLDAIYAGRLTKIADKLPKLKLVAAARIADFLPKIKGFLGKLLGKIPTGKVTPLPGVNTVLTKDVINSETLSSRLPAIDITPDDKAYIQYTGGTTGAPKGAELSHRNVASNAVVLQKWLGWEKDAESVALSGFPFFHMAGLTFNINAISLGWTQVLIPNPRDVAHICKEMTKYRPAILVNVPSLYQMLMAYPPFKTLDHSNLELCVSGAAPFPKESQEELESIVGKNKLVEVYGMTETSPLITVNPARGKKKLGSIGLPILNTDIKLRDTETGEEVDIGQPGEICVKGPQVMVGYYKKPDATKGAFDEEGYLLTGDVAVQDEEGYLTIVDRTKDMLLVSGFNVFSKKLEETLSEHPAIEMSAIVGSPDPKRPGSEIVKAYITVPAGYGRKKKEEVIRQEISEFAKEKLAKYEVPKIIEFLEEMPLTAVGKVDKKELRKKEGQ